jgi:hypothetical protein
MDAWMRASDADRERTVAELRRHVTDGRISVEEFSERTAATYAARTFGDLDAVTADLPPVEHERPADAASRSWARPTWLIAGLAALTVIGTSLLAGLAHATAAAAPMMSGWCP